jgi:GT2 family glycosyltransferase
MSGDLQAAYFDLLDVLALERAYYEAEMARLRGDPYPRFVERRRLRRDDLDRLRVESTWFPQQPKISIATATYRTDPRHLHETIESVRAQTYENWEWCVADDASGEPHISETFRATAALDPRIKFVARDRNGHISQALNSALSLATGEFVGFLDHDDLLAPNALHEVAALVNRSPDIDIIYTDEDMLDDENGVRCNPHFKPDWSPDSFLSRMYTGHFMVVRRTLVEELGGFRSEFDGSQDYDLMLRATERSDRIAHIPDILYHWRMHAESTASDQGVKPYASRAAERALEEALARRGERATVSERPDCAGVYVVRYAMRRKHRASIVIPTRDHGDDVARCIASIRERPSVVESEILIVDNGSTDPASLQTFERLRAGDPTIRVVRYDVPFNFSQICNYGAALSIGDVLVFLNNDIEIISTDWLEAMVEQAERPDVGAVGATLFYPNDTIQHAGVIIGIGGVAGHGHKNMPRESDGHYMMLKSINNYSAVTGAMLAIERSKFERAGGFDEMLAVAFNDVDFCLRVRALGLRNLVLPHATAYHFESKSRGSEADPVKAARFARETDAMRERWNLRDFEDPHYNRNLTLAREDYSVEA